MSGLLALALLTQAAANESSSGSASAIRAFREACIEGSLKLSPDRGRILHGSEIVGLARLSAWGYPTTRRTVIKLNDLPETYLIMADYAHLQRHSVASTCSLVSTSLRREEAGRAFLDGLAPPTPRPVWWPNILYPYLVADYPEKGFYKSLRYRNDGSIVLTVGIYADAATRNPQTEPKSQ